MAATENDGDYTAGVKLAGPDATGLWYVVDVRRGRWGTDTRNQEIKAAALSDGTSVKIRGPQDPGAAGKEAAKAFVRMLAGYTVKTAMVSGAKEVRADPFSAQVNAGNVRLLRGDWNAAFIEELRTFPGGKHDDQVDAVSDAFAELAVPRRKWGEWS
jgi:predicted phage terminase large subunit-like protein